MDNDVGRDDNREIMYCADDNEYRKLCIVFDNLALDKFLKKSWSWNSY